MYSVDIENKGSYNFKIRTNDYEFDIDIKGRAVTPPDALLASIGSCVGVYIRKYFEGVKLELKDFNIKVEADLSKEPPVRFKEIQVFLDLKNTKLDEKRKKSLLDFIKNCPVGNTLKNNPNIKVVLK